MWIYALSIFSKIQLKFWMGGGYHSYLRTSPHKLVIKIALFESCTFNDRQEVGFTATVETPPLRFNDRFLHSADGRNSGKNTAGMKTSYAHRTSYHQSGYIIFEPSEELVRGCTIQRMTTDKIAVPLLKQGTYGKSYDSMEGTQIPGYRFTGYRSILRPIRPGQIHPTVKHGSTNRRS